MRKDTDLLVIQIDFHSSNEKGYQFQSQRIFFTWKLVAAFQSNTIMAWFQEISRSVQ